MLDQGSGNIGLDKQGLIDLRTLSHDTGFDTPARTPATGVALRSLAKKQTKKQWPILSEVEIPELPWQMLAVGMLKWTYSGSALFMVSVFTNEPTTKIYL